MCDKIRTSTEATMTTEPTWCARGCYAYDRHLADCDGTDWHTPACVDAACVGCNPERCDGCQPRETAQVPDDLVPVMCKIAARGKILPDDLVAIERAGITLGIEVQMPTREAGEWAVRHRKTRVIRPMRDRGDAENEARLNPDVETVRRSVTTWRAP